METPINPIDIIVRTQGATNWTEEIVMALNLLISERFSKSKIKNHISLTKKEIINKLSEITHSTDDLYQNEKVETGLKFALFQFRKEGWTVSYHKYGQEDTSIDNIVFSIDLDS
jgi:hypothetical protein